MIRIFVKFSRGLPLTFMSGRTNPYKTVVAEMDGWSCGFCDNPSGKPKRTKEMRGYVSVHDCNKRTTSENEHEAKRAEKGKRRKSAQVTCRLWYTTHRDKSLRSGTKREHKTKGTTSQTTTIANQNEKQVRARRKTPRASFIFTRVESISRQRFDQGKHEQRPHNKEAPDCFRTRHTTRPTKSAPEHTRDHNLPSHQEHKRTESYRTPIQQHETD